MKIDEKEADRLALLLWENDPLSEEGNRIYNEITRKYYNTNMEVAVMERLAFLILESINNEMEKLSKQYET